MNHFLNHYEENLYRLALHGKRDTTTKCLAWRVVRAAPDEKQQMHLFRLMCVFLRYIQSDEFWGSCRDDEQEPATVFMKHMRYIHAMRFFDRLIAKDKERGRYSGSAWLERFFHLCIAHEQSDLLGPLLDFLVSSRPWEQLESPTQPIGVYDAWKQERLVCERFPEKVIQMWRTCRFSRDMTPQQIGYAMADILDDVEDPLARKVLLAQAVRCFSSDPDEEAKYCDAFLLKRRFWQSSPEDADERTSLP